MKVVPYALGELGYWGQDLTANDLTRAYYQAGIRATLPMWAVDSEAESTLWNVHGLAHKVEFQAEYLHAQSSQSMDQLPLYDPLDDWQIEDFRRRFVVNTFGIPAVPPPGFRGPPPRFDERFYALRTDMEGWVTAPSMEIADNLDELRLGVHQRWQTKRGPADCPHIIDWIEFDTDFTIFPDATRDNFGSIARPVGLQLRLARGRPADGALRRHLRFLRPGAEDRNGGHVPDPAAARVIVRRLPPPGRPDRQPGTEHVVQLLDEPEVDQHDGRVD